MARDALEKIVKAAASTKKTKLVFTGPYFEDVLSRDGCGCVSVSPRLAKNIRKNLKKAKKRKSRSVLGSLVATAETYKGSKPLAVRYGYSSAKHKRHAKCIKT